MKINGQRDSNNIFDGSLKQKNFSSTLQGTVIGSRNQLIVKDQDFELEVNNLGAVYLDLDASFINCQISFTGTRLAVTEGRYIQFINCEFDFTANPSSYGNIVCAPTAFIEMIGCKIPENLNVKPYNNESKIVQI